MKKEAHSCTHTNYETRNLHIASHRFDETSSGMFENEKRKIITKSTDRCCCCFPYYIERFVGRAVKRGETFLHYTNILSKHKQTLGRLLVFPRYEFRCPSMCVFVCKSEH